MTFTIEQNGDVVRLDMLHEDFPPDSRVFVACSQGWPPILSGLKALLETQKPVMKTGMLIRKPVEWEMYGVSAPVTVKSIEPNRRIVLARAWCQVESCA